MTIQDFHKNSEWLQGSGNSEKPEIEENTHQEQLTYIYHKIEAHIKNICQNVNKIKVRT